MKQGYEQERVRKHPVKFRFSDDKAEQIKEIPITHFIVNLIIWNVFRKLDKVDDLSSPHIFDGSKISEDISLIILTIHSLHRITKSWI